MLCFDLDASVPEASSGLFVALAGDAFSDDDKIRRAVNRPTDEEEDRSILFVCLYWFIFFLLSNDSIS